MRPAVRICLVVVVAFVLACSAKATTLLPGASATPDVFTTSLGAMTLQADTGTLPWSTTTISGSAESAVFGDPGNVFCAGCLDFLFAVLNSNSSTDNIERISDTSFAGFQTHVGYNNSAPCGLGPNATPDTVDRSTNASVVGFNYKTPNGVAPSDCTVILEVETDATSYRQGTLNIIDGSVASVTSYAPTVPEPGTLVLFGSGLISLSGLVRRKLLQA